MQKTNNPPIKEKKPAFTERVNTKLCQKAPFSSDGSRSSSSHLWGRKVQFEVWMEEHSRRLLLVNRSHLPVWPCWFSRSPKAFEDLSQVLFQVNRLEVRNQAELQSGCAAHPVYAAGVKPRRD